MSVGKIYPHDKNIHYSNTDERRYKPLPLSELLKESQFSFGVWTWEVGNVAVASPMLVF